MSEFNVMVVRLGTIEKHPNADLLGITYIYDYPVIVRRQEFNEGDLAVYIPVDSVVPVDDPRWSFLDGKNRIKAKRLRGIFSMGLLIKAEPDWNEGQDVKKILKIEKYEVPEQVTFGVGESCPFNFPVYTDIQALRRWPYVLITGEEIVITEKIHGVNFRAIFRDGRLWVGSHTQVKRPDETNTFWRAAHQYQLDKILETIQDVIIFGELYGSVQDLHYGCKCGKNKLVFFDILFTKTNRFANYECFTEILNRIGLIAAAAPVLYRGPWDTKLTSLADGRTVLDDTHIREGIVIRPIAERFDDRIGRVILKYHGEGYLMR